MGFHSVSANYDIWLKGQALSLRSACGGGGSRRAGDVLLGSELYVMLVCISRAGENSSEKLRRWDQDEYTRNQTAYKNNENEPQRCVSGLIS